jgi:hypothetical protein
MGKELVSVTEQCCLLTRECERQGGLGNWFAKECPWNGEFREQLSVKIKHRRKEWGCVLLKQQESR